MRKKCIPVGVWAPAALAVFTGAAPGRCASDSLVGGALPVWHVPVGAEGARLLTAWRDMVVAATEHGRLEIRALATGALVSSLDIGSGPAHQPAVWGDIALVAATDGALSAFSLTKRTMLWRRETGGRPSPPGVVGDKFYAGFTADDHGEVWGLSPTTGRRHLRAPIRGGALSRPVPAGGSVFVGTSGGEIVAVDPGTGRSRVAYSTRGEFYGSAIEALGTRLLIAPTGYHRKLSALGLRNGALTEAWAVSFVRPLYLDASAVNEVAFLRPGTDAGVLRKVVARATGKVDLDPWRDFLPLGPVHASKWTVRGDRAAAVTREPGIPPRARYTVLVVDVAGGGTTLRYEWLGPDVAGLGGVAPLLCDDAVIAFLGGNRMVGLDPREGTVVWERKTEGMVTSDPVMRGDFMLVATDAGIEAFRVPVRANVPRSFAIHPNAPNPFRRWTLLRYDIAQRAEVQLRIFDSKGRRIASLADGVREPGTYKAAWGGTNEQGSPAPAGVYFARFRAGKYRNTVKMTLSK